MRPPTPRQGRGRGADGLDCKMQDSAGKEIRENGHGALGGNSLLFLLQSNERNG